MPYKSVKFIFISNSSVKWMTNVPAADVKMMNQMFQSVEGKLAKPLPIFMLQIKALLIMVTYSQPCLRPIIT